MHISFHAYQDFKQGSGLKGPLSSLKQFLTIESPLQMMKNAFYSMLKALFILDIFTFLSWRFGFAEKQLDKKTTGSFKIHDVTGWTIYTIHI